MQFIRDIFLFVWRALKSVSSFMYLVATSILTAITGFCAFVYHVAQGAFGIVPYLVELCDRLTTVVQQFQDLLSSNPYWAFFYDLFALDVFAEGLAYFLTLFGLVAFLSLFGFAFAALSAITPFLIIRLIRSGISVVSAGFVKP